MFGLTLPRTTVYRLWDLILWHGSHMLLAATLTALEIRARAVLAAQTFDEVVTALGNRAMGEQSIYTRAARACTTVPFFHTSPPVSESQRFAQSTTGCLRIIDPIIATGDAVARRLKSLSFVDPRHAHAAVQP